MLLLHGENTYLSKQRLDELIVTFTSKHGSNGLVVLNGAVCSVESIFQEIESISMFVPIKLLVIKHFSENKDNKKLMKAITDAKLVLPKEVKLIFWENSSADKRSSFYKMFSKEGNVEEYKKESRAKLVSYVLSEFKKRKKRIDRNVVNTLISHTGEDMNQLISEIEKLSLYSEEKDISLSDIEELVPVSAKLKVWEMLDAIGIGDKRKAIDIFERLMNQGEDPNHLISLVIWQFRQLLQYKYASSNGLNSSQIASTLGISPYSARKLASSTSGFDFRKLCVIYDKLVDIDFARKVSAIDPRFAVTLLLSAV